MITIIHGDDVVSSRNLFLEEKKKSTSPIVDAATLELSYLVQMFEGTSLLSDNKNLFVEYFFSKISSKMLDDIASYLNRVHKNGHIVFWESKEIGKKSLTLFKNPTIRTFKLPKALFAFLESIQPGARSNLAYFHKALQTTEPELLFYMIVRQFRLLIAILAGSKNSIDEVTRLAPWQRGRLKRQARFFSLDSLKRNYEKLFAIELAHKTGKSPLSLTQSIDFFLADL